MRPTIIALGRSDNHPLLARHARALGVEYLGIEGFEASDLMRDRSVLAKWISALPQSGSIFLAAIDISISSATLNSFFAALSEGGVSRLSLRTNPALLEMKGEETPEKTELLQILTFARSPHGQVAIWPIISLDSSGGILEDGVDAEAMSLLINQALREIGDLGLVGALTYIFNPHNQVIVRREFGASTLTFWSESASYTPITEQMVRAILDLPLGDARSIDFEEYFLEEVLSLEPDLIADPIRPFLHLFARNPRLKVHYVTEDEGDVSVPTAARLSLFASSEREARDEMDHARGFMLGLADEHAP